MNNKEFEEVYKQGKRFYSAYFIFIVLLSKEKKCGIVVSKKHGSAVSRNKIKRRLRTIFQKIVGSLINNCFVVIIPRPNIGALSFGELVEKFNDAAKKAKLIY